MAGTRLQHARTTATALAIAAALIVSCSTDDGPDDTIGIDEVDASADVVDEASDADEDAPDGDATAEDVTPEDDEAPDEDHAPDEAIDDAPFALPDEIDPAYADTVINELFRILGDVRVDARADLQPGDSLTTELLDRIRAVTSEVRFAREASSIQNQVDDDFPFAPDTLGQLGFESDVIIDDAGRCLLALGTYDLTGVTDFDLVRAAAEEDGTEALDPDFDGRQSPYFFALVPLDESRDPQGINSTGWVLAFGGGDPEGDPDWRPDPASYSETCS